MKNSLSSSLCYLLPMVAVVIELYLQGRILTGMNLARPFRSIARNQKCNCQQIYSISKKYINGTPSVLSSEEKEKNEDNSVSSIDDLTEPTNCCMSGCANCVWIQYAEKLSAVLEKSEVDVQKLIIDKVQDPNMKAFLSMELRFKNITKD